VSDLQWEAPPPRPDRQNRDWPAIATALKGRPGDWLVAATCPTVNTAAVIAHHVRAGKYPAVAEGFEAVARTVYGEHRVYVRYVGRGDEAG
jgi:hypothetical protein